MATSKWPIVPRSSRPEGTNLLDPAGTKAKPGHRSDPRRDAEATKRKSYLHMTSSVSSHTDSRPVSHSYSDGPTTRNEPRPSTHESDHGSDGKSDPSVINSILQVSTETTVADKTIVLPGSTQRSADPTGGRCGTAPDLPLGVGPGLGAKRPASLEVCSPCSATVLVQAGKVLQGKPVHPGQSGEPINYQRRGGVVEPTSLPP